ncbi:hypothetical protein HanRHA438_Chr02g0059941 [Helianthus annuus]|nr:hypothetical protein HanRHA438_Chr02g0059941 [Helianthus annuus]
MYQLNLALDMDIKFAIDMDTHFSLSLSLSLDNFFSRSKIIHNQPPKFFFLSKSFIINHQNSRSTSVTTQ